MILSCPWLVVLLVLAGSIVAVVSTGMGNSTSCCCCWCWPWEQQEVLEEGPLVDEESCSITMGQQQAHHQQAQHFQQQAQHFQQQAQNAHTSKNKNSSKPSTTSSHILIEILHEPKNMIWMLWRLLIWWWRLLFGCTGKNKKGEMWEHQRCVLVYWFTATTTTAGPDDQILGLIS